MSDPSRYLASLAQALAKMSLYAEGHPARARAAAISFESLRELQRADRRPRFTFLGREVIYHRRVMPDLRDWDWAERLSSSGMQRLEIDGDVAPEEYRQFLEQVSARMATSASPCRPRHLVSLPHAMPIRFGALGVHEAVHAIAPPTGDAGESPDLSKEADAVEWIHAAVRDDVALPVAEADLVVAPLGQALHSERKIILPLLTLKEFDQYTTTHAINVAVLAMALAEYLGLSPREVRSYGMGADAILHAVIRCWESARSDHALDDRRQQGLSVERPQIAVLVQQLVASDVSAVIFSANPITGNRDEIMINARWGLGESIVGGTVTPDTLIVRKSDLAVVQRIIADKQWMTVSVPGGTREVEVPRFLRNLSSLNDGQVLETAKLALALETTMEHPVDVECAYAGGELYLLQCRPITTLR